MWQVMLYWTKAVVLAWKSSLAESTADFTAAQISWFRFIFVIEQVQQNLKPNLKVQM